MTPTATDTFGRTVASSTSSRRRCSSVGSNVNAVGLNPQVVVATTLAIAAIEADLGR